MIVISIYILIIIFSGILHKVNCFNSFQKGVKKNFTILLDIFPNLLALVFAIEVFNKSGIIDFLSSKIHFPIVPEIIVQAGLKPLSSSSSLVIMIDIYKKYGVDSSLGKLSSIIQGCSDTTLYILTIYFSSIQITKTKYALAAGLLTDLLTFLIVIFIYLWLFI